MMQKYDYIVVGQGIVGTILAFKLFQSGKKVLVIDDSHKMSSSSVAAGIINPITGRNYVKSWKIEALIKSFTDTYTEISAFLGNEYLVKRDVIRVLHNAKQENAWMERYGDRDYQHFMSPEVSEQIPYEGIQCDGRYGYIYQAYQLRIAWLIIDFRNYLINHQYLLSQNFEHSALEVNGNIHYESFTSDNIVFCEGFQVINNPYFNFLPFDPVKGEALIIRASKLKLKHNFRDQIFVSPLGDDLYWIGAGYNKSFDDTLPSYTEKQRLLSVLDVFMLCSYTVVEHIAGIRPATKTRKPIIGSHPIYKNVYLCNGMGAKGSSLAPYFTQSLINFIEKQIPLDAEVDIQNHYNSFNRLN